MEFDAFSSDSTTKSIVSELDSTFDSSRGNMFNWIVLARILTACAINFWFLELQDINMGFMNSGCSLIDSS